MYDSFFVFTLLSVSDMDDVCLQSVSVSDNIFISYAKCLTRQFLVHSNMYVKAAVHQIILENHELCKYAKISLHIHIIVDLNQNIA